jgi:hypothetical protein
MEEAQEIVMGPVVKYRYHLAAKVAGLLRILWGEGRK